jgi:hypothetical protein
MYWTGHWASPVIGHTMTVSLALHLQLGVLRGLGDSIPCTVIRPLLLLPSSLPCLAHGNSFRLPNIILMFAFLTLHTNGEGQPLSRTYFGWCSSRACFDL